MIAIEKAPHGKAPFVPLFLALPHAPPRLQSQPRRRTFGELDSARFQDFMQIPDGARERLALALSWGSPDWWGRGTDTFKRLAAQIIDAMIAAA